MSYAAVAAENAPPLSQQPRPDPGLLNTTPSTHSNIADDNLKVNVVGPEFKEHPRTTTSEAHKIDDSSEDYEVPAPPKGDRSKKDFKDLDDERRDMWDVTKYYLFQPGIAGGLIGIINIGVFASIGHTFYTRPDLRQNATAISSAVGGSMALVFVEGYIAEAYSKTPRGKGRRARKDGALIYRQLHEQIMRPQVLGGLVGIVNTAVLGGVGYFAYTKWNKPWDRRIVSAISIGLLTMWGGEGVIAERLSRK